MVVDNEATHLDIVQIIPCYSTSHHIQYNQLDSGQWTVDSPPRTNVIKLQHNYHPMHHHHHYHIHHHNNNNNNDYKYVLFCPFLLSEKVAWLVMRIDKIDKRRIKFFVSSARKSWRCVY